MLSEYIVCHINSENVRLEHILYILYIILYSLGCLLQLLDVCLN